MRIINIRTNLGKFIECSQYSELELNKIYRFYTAHEDYEIIVVEDISC